MRDPHKWPRLRRGLAALALAAALAPGFARAESLGQIGQKASQISGEASELERTVRAPSDLNRSDDLPQRRYLDAKVQYSVGNYADASILLFDIVERFQSSRVYRDAVFLLADSLYMRGTNLTARKYYRVVVDQFGESDENYPKAVERLLELSVRLSDQEGVADLLARLDRIPAGRQLDSGPYVRGKFAYFSGDLDGALSVFGGISEANEYYFQARYFMATVFIAKDDLAQAVKTLYDLLKVQPKNKKQARVVELTHMALGRLHYHRDQPSEAIAQYLMVSRRSDLFDDALYEVAFVYVKGRQFDKALRALELLEMATGGSCAKANTRTDTVLDMPEVCVLKGNLGIRKAQSFAEDGKGNPVEEYATALAVFQHTRDAYQAPRAELERILKSGEDPKTYFAAVTAKDGAAFDTGALPEVARKFLRREPEVARVVVVTEDLEQIRADVAEAERTISRLDRVLNSPRRVHIFPSIADKQTRLYELGEALFTLRMQVADEERALVERTVQGQERAEWDAIAAKRRALGQELAQLPGGTAPYGQRVKLAQERYQTVEAQAKEVEVQIGGLEAELVAIEKYWKDTPDKGADRKLDTALFTSTVAEIRGAIAELKTELAGLQEQLIVAKDEAGLGDDVGEDARRVRVAMLDAAREEHAFFQRISPRFGGGDASRAREIEGTVNQIDSAQAAVDRAQGKIDGVLDTELAGVRAELEVEKASLADGKAKLAAYDGENHELGGAIIASSFTTVSKKFYEITVRAEVGIIDVSWARKEEAENNFNRIEVDSAREKRTLQSEFSEVAHDEAPAAPSAPEGGNAP